MFYPHISWLVLVGSDRKQQTSNQCLHIDRRYKSEQELPCNMRGKSNVHTVEIFPFGCTNRACSRSRDVKL